MAPATPYPAPAVNLVARAATRPSRVGLFAHIDTERAGAGWTTPPLEARVRDRRLYGLGVADDKGAWRPWPWRPPSCTRRDVRRPL